MPYPSPSLPIPAIPQAHPIHPKNPNPPHLHPNPHPNKEVDIHEPKKTPLTKIPPPTPKDLIIVLITGLAAKGPRIKDPTMNIITSAIRLRILTRVDWVLALGAFLPVKRARP